MKILFIGNFLSRRAGSVGASETIAHLLSHDCNFETKLISKYSNRILRFIDVFLHTLFDNYDVIHIDLYSGKSFYLAWLSKRLSSLRNKQQILTLHGGALIEFYKGRETLLNNIFEGASVQSPSQFLVSFFSSKGFKIKYVPNVVQLERFPYHSRMQKVCKILWVRAFTSIYNPQVAVFVLSKVLENIPEATLTMIGPDKGMMRQTQKLISDFGLTDRVNILGPIDNINLYQYYQSHAVYLNTTTYESFGIALVEAASCGVPIVSFRVGEIPYLWTDEENILLCELGDVEKMAEQVSRILLDTDLSTRLSINARKKVENYSWQNVQNHWTEVVTR